MQCSPAVFLAAGHSGPQVASVRLATTPTLKEPISASVHGGLAYTDEATQLEVSLHAVLRATVFVRCCSVLVLKEAVRARQPEHFNAYARSMHVCIYVLLGRSGY